jgi:hypothetical protein
MKKVKEVRVQKILPNIALNPKKINSNPKIEMKLADEVASFSGGESPKKGNILSDTETE